MTGQDKDYLTGLRQSNEEIFEQLFNDFYDPLYACALTMVRDRTMAEEVVQSVFVQLWESRKKIDIRHSLRAYLYRSVYHAVIAAGTKANRQAKYILHLSRVSENSPAATPVETKELEMIIGRTLMELPESCRTIFQLSRYEQMKYRDIADHLQISVKTVEAQMTKALKILRERLADFLPLLLILIQYHT